MGGENTHLVLEQDHLGILPGRIILAADVRLDDTGVIGAQYSEEVVDAGLSFATSIHETAMIE